MALLLLGVFVWFPQSARSGDVAPAAGDRVAIQTVFKELSLSAAELKRVLGGGFVKSNLKPSSGRELSIAIAFLVAVDPGAFAADLDHAMAIRDDPDTLSFVEIDPKQPEVALGKVALGDDAARRWLAATAGEAINLSSGELEQMAALRKELAGKASVRAAVNEVVRRILLDRYRAYRDSGLEGIAPYQRGGGSSIDAAGELRNASLAAKKLGLFEAPFYEMLLQYPKARPPEFEESFFFIHYRAHGETAFMLTHRISAADGSKIGSVQRQFYVSRTYNVEQSLSLLLPTGDGTLVAYTNRTSTDQVEGFGGGARRSIGRRLLASQLEALYQKVRADAEKKP